MSDMRPMAFVSEPGKIEIRERPIPPLRLNDVQIRVRAVTICGSDLHIFRGAHPSVSLPVPVGHEIAGEVIRVGAEVKRVKPGDRVTIEPVIVCGVCNFCTRGDYHLCANISFQYREGQGGITTDFVANERWAHLIPEDLSYGEGALIEPLAVAVHAVRRAKLDLGDSAAIFGAGPIGLLILIAARVMGAGDIFISDVRDFRLRAAEELGSSLAINASNNDVVSMIRGATSGEGVQGGFEAAGLRYTLNQLLVSLRKGGRGVLVGLYEQDEVLIPANSIVQKEITLLGSQGYHWDFQRAIKLFEAKKLEISRLITHRFTLDQVQQAFDLLEDPDSQAIKVLIEP